MFDKFEMEVSELVEEMNLKISKLVDMEIFGDWRLDVNAGNVFFGDSGYGFNIFTEFLSPKNQQKPLKPDQN